MIEQKSFTDFAKDYTQDSFVEITIGGNISSYKSTSIAGDIMVFVPVNDVLISFNVLDKTEEKILNQILSTFRFLDEVDTSTWQTYTNEEYGFEFKYPGDLRDYDWDSSYEKFLLTLVTSDFEVDNSRSPTNGITLSGGKLQVGVLDNQYSYFISNDCNYFTGPGSFYTGSECKSDNFNGYPIKSFIWARNEKIFSKYVYIHVNDSIYSVNYDSVSGLDESIFNQILSTFKFIE
jgi:hypothetical protein